MVGGETYEAIKLQSKRFYDMLTEAQKPVKYEVIPKKQHVPMISQLVFGANPLYQSIIEFMQSH